MRKSIAAVVASFALSAVWLSIFAGNPQAADNSFATPPTVHWEYTSTENELASLGKQGWEAYAVTRQDNGICQYYLKRAAK